MSELKEFKCPNCEGRLQFDTDSQKLKCPYCDGVFDPELARQRNSSSLMPHISEHEKKLRREQYEILMRSKGIEIKD